MGTCKCTCENCRHIGKAEYVIIGIVTVIPTAWVYYLITEVLK